ncbi:MAG: NAD(P)-dependent oxidoreductase [Verrucomicrobiales bacterium]|jgi:3-hydroxyisobutyrate dehydrogenase|nr:NAD(P)-dependent oxidoreductase [Verrucomicrobiales bacterium]
MPEKIAFVGVGRMGANMARHLKDCNFTISAVYDTHEPTAVALAKELDITITHPGSLAAVTANADIIITVVSDDNAQLSIFSESGDSLLTTASGKTFINCATLTPSVHQEVERRATLVGASTLEACMASSITQARNGTLYLMCGGDRATFERVKPILEHLGSNPRYIGPTGQASQVKALVNMVMNINTAGLAEGLGLGDALGLDLAMLRDVFSQTGANSQVLKTDGEDMQNREHSCFFSSAHAAKDSTIAWKLGSQLGLNLPLAAATRLQYERLSALGLGELDKSAVSELTFKDRNG